MGEKVLRKFSVSWKLILLVCATRTVDNFVEQSFGVDYYLTISKHRQIMCQWPKSSRSSRLFLEMAIFKALPVLYTTAMRSWSTGTYILVHAGCFYK